MGNRAALQAALPAMLRHEGWWDGWYRDFDSRGRLLDERQVRTHCEFPDLGPWHYIQHNWLTWADGREAVYEFGGRLEGGMLRWDTNRFSGHGWETQESVLMLRLDRLDVADAHYIEMISIAPDNRAVREPGNGSATASRGSGLCATRRGSTRQPDQRSSSTSS